MLYLYVDKYRKLLNKENINSPEDHFLDLLNTRDKIASIYESQIDAWPSLQKQIISCDLELCEQSKNFAGIKQLKNWRKSVNPPKSFWWWYLDELPSRLSPIWAILSSLFLLLDIGIVLEVSLRLLGGVLNFAGATILIVQGSLTFLLSDGILTKRGEDNIIKVIDSLGFPKKILNLVKFLLTLIFLFFLVFAHKYVLPRLAIYFNDRGFDDYTAGRYVSSMNNYKLALSINPRLLEAHYNFGKLYNEKLFDRESAKREYLFATQSGYLKAYAPLAQIYISEGNYPLAINIVAEGLRSDYTKEIENELRVTMGWAQIKLHEFSRAQAMLEEVVKSNSYIESDAHCLMGISLQAQVYEGELFKQDQAIKSWKNCLSSKKNIDIERKILWLYTASECFSNAKGEKCKKHVKNFL